MPAQKLSDILLPGSVLAPMRAGSRDEAIAALVEVLPLPREVRGALWAAVLVREDVGSTGLGNGVAVPHARLRRIDAPMMAAGLVKPPIDFRSADGKLVSLVLLLAVPDADPTAHLKTLAALSRLASDTRLLRRVNKAASGPELYSLLVGLPV